MAALAAAERASRQLCTLYDVGGEVCPYDAGGGCRRMNAQHWLACAHPVGRRLPRCEHLLRLQPCPHLAHRCTPTCQRPCPTRAAADAHCVGVTHCPCVTELERAAAGEPPAGKRLLATTTTTTTTSTTSTTTTTVTDVAPKRARVGGVLAQTFVVPPFSVLDAGSGYWQARKREWLNIGLDGGLGRDQDLLGEGLAALTPGLTGTSVFDPVTVEIALKWYAPKPTRDAPVVVVDPFAGGSTRGVVCAKLGYLYVGTDVSARQVEANRVQATDLCTDCKWQPRWAVCCGSKLGEALEGVRNELALPVGLKADMLLTCPP